MTDEAAPPSRRFAGKAFLLAVLSAPGAAFVLWSVWSLGTSAVGVSSLPGQLLGALLLFALVTGWGALPTAAFGALILIPLERAFRGRAPVAALFPAGMTAAGLYAGCGTGLALTGQQWVFLAAPWTVGLLDPEQRGFHGLAPMIVAIVLSGGVAALVYARVAGRFGVRPA